MQTEIMLGLQVCLQSGRLVDQNKTAPAAISPMKRSSIVEPSNFDTEPCDPDDSKSCTDKRHFICGVLDIEAVDAEEETHRVHSPFLYRQQTEIQKFAYRRRQEWIG